MGRYENRSAMIYHRFILFKGDLKRSHYILGCSPLVEVALKAPWRQRRSGAGVLSPEIEKLLKISRAGVSNAVKRIENKIEEVGKCRMVIESGR